MSKKKTPVSDKSGGLPLLGFALSAALAGAAGYMYVTHKEEIDKEAKKRIDQLAKQFKQSRPEIERRVKKTWGEVSKGAIAVYLDVRSALLHALEEENLQKGGKMIQAKYDKIVEDVIGNAKKSGMISPEVEKKLTELLKMDWKDVEKNLMGFMVKGTEKAVKFVRKAQVSRQVRAVKKTLVKAAKQITKSAPKKAAPKKAANKKR